MPTKFIHARFFIAWPVWAGGYPEPSAAVRTCQSRSNALTAIFEGELTVKVRRLEWALGGYREVAGLSPTVRMQNSVELSLALEVDERMANEALRAALGTLTKSIKAFCDTDMPGAAAGANIYEVACEVGEPSIDPGAPQKLKVKALILKGGGVKGLAFAGALEVLEQFYEFEMYAGASAGAIAATLLAAGYSPKELHQVLGTTNFASFLDTPVLLRLPRLMLLGGMHSGDAFRAWMRARLSAKLPKVSGVKLEDLQGRAIIFASSFPEGRIWFDSKGTGKDTSADFAVRCSMAIPYFFDAVSHGGSRIVDGGVLNNFPIRAVLENFPEARSSFVALYLGSSKLPDHKPRSLLVELLAMWTGQDELALVDKYRDQTVVIDPDPISTTDFTLTDDEKMFLVLQGKAAALDFVHRRGLRNAPSAAEVEEAAGEARTKGDQVARTRRRRRWLGPRTLVPLALSASLALAMLGREGMLPWPQRRSGGSPTGTFIPTADAGRVNPTGSARTRTVEELCAADTSGKARSPECAKTVKAPRVELAKISFGEINQEAETLRDRIIGLNQQPAATPESKAGAWCALARVTSSYSEQATRGCKEWTDYASKTKELASSLEAALAELESYTALGRLSEREKAAAVKSFLEDYYPLRADPRVMKVKATFREMLGVHTPKSVENVYFTLSRRPLELPLPDNQPTLALTRELAALGDQLEDTWNAKLLAYDQTFDPSSDAGRSLSWREYERGKHDFVAQSEVDLRDLASRLVMARKAAITELQNSTPSALTYLWLAEIECENAESKFSEAGRRYEREIAALDLKTRLVPKEPEADFSSALALAQKVRSEFPDDRLGDAALYILGYSFQKNKQPIEAYKAYKQLVDQFPASRFWVEAHVRIGDYLFDAYDYPLGEREALLLAAKSFEAASNDRSDPLAYVALYRLGWTWWRLEEQAKALRAFEAVIEWHGRDDLAPEAARWKSVIERAAIAP